ncbi:unnamed protein product [Discosporangium mesarthrocarpum]
MSLRRGAEEVMRLPHLLPGLLRAAEHGEGLGLRAKAFLALQFALDAGPPELLERACQGRLLSVLTRAVSSLAHNFKALSPPQVYLYQCCLGLVKYLCTVPGRAARRLAGALHREVSANSVGGRGLKAGMGTLVESASVAFVAVVKLINSPFLRPLAVTSAFVVDLANCLLLSKRATSGKGDGPVLEALLPTVESIAQRKPWVLHRCQEVVSSELVPALCSLLCSTCGDTRALVMGVLLAVLPPVLCTSDSACGLGHEIQGGNPSVLQQSSSREQVSINPSARSTVVEHLLPKMVRLLSDQPPVPQYTVRLLIDMGRAWQGLGIELLAQGMLPLLLEYLPPRWPLPIAKGIDMCGQGGGVGARGLYGKGQPRPDQKIADLLALLVDEGGAVLEELVQLGCPGRAAAAIARAVDTATPEALEASLGLAVTLLRASSQAFEGSTGDPWPPGSPHAGLGAQRCEGLGASLLHSHLEPLLAAVLAVVEGIWLFCTDEGLALGERVGAGGFVDAGLRSTISDSATQFLIVCHQLFRDQLLDQLFYSEYNLPRACTNGTHSGRAPSEVLATILLCQAVEVRAKLHMLQLVRAACVRSSIFCVGLMKENNQLWFALMHLLQGDRCSEIMGVEQGHSLSPMEGVARDIVNLVRGARDAYAVS